jgi:HlyD family secretion protein
MTGLGQAQRLVSVPVQEGDRVRAGDVVARLDDAALLAAIDAARAARRASLAQIGVLAARLDDVADARSTIADNRATVRDAIAKLSRTRTDLAEKLAAAKKQLATLRALQRSLPSRPPGSRPPTGSVPPGGAPNPAQIAAAISKLESALAQLTAGIAKIDAGLAQARSGLAKLDDASATTADARSALRGVRGVAREATGATAVAIRLAEAQRDLTVLYSPVNGVVDASARSGESVISGAPVVSIRPDASSAVDVYLPPERLGDLAVGDSAIVEIDSHPGQRHPATVTMIGARAVYPPSWMSTTEVHMTRALPVRVTLDDPEVVLPAGTPADVTLEMDSK